MSAPTPTTAAFAPNHPTAAPASTAAPNHPTAAGRPPPATAVVVPHHRSPAVVLYHPTAADSPPPRPLRSSPPTTPQQRRRATPTATTCNAGVLRMGLVSAIVLECVDFFLQGSRISGGSVDCSDVIFVFSEGKRKEKGKR